MNCRESRVRKLGRVGAAALALAWIFCAVPAGHAQQPKEDPLKVQRGAGNVPGQPPPGVGVVQQQGKPFYLQGAVVVLLTGGAVWTVCRSSRRQ